MNKFCLRIIITLLAATSFSACKPATPILPTHTPTLPVDSKTPTSSTETKATVTPTSAENPTHTPSPEPIKISGDWTTYTGIQSIRDMGFDRKDNLWAVGPEGVVVLKPDGTKEYFTVEDGLPSNDLLSVGFDTQDNVWVGTRSSGAARYDGEVWQTFTAQDGLGADEVLDIVYYLESWGVLVGTKNGLSVFRDSWENYSGLSYLPDNEIRAIAILRGNKIWLGTPKGLRLFETSETYTTANGLPNDEVNAIAIAPDCSLWLGTSGGVSHYIGGAFTSYTKSEGLANNLVSSAAVTLDGTAWFGTPSGVSRFDGNTWTTYTTDDGLADNDVLSIEVAPDETLWIGTAGGLSHFSPSIALPSIDTGTSAHENMGDVSGLQIVYPKNNNLWVWSEGVTRQITRGGNVNGFKLSDDGNKVAFTRMVSYPTSELWVINIDGSGERLLVSTDDLQALGKSSETEEIRQSESYILLSPYAWVPGTYTIAYGTYRSIRYDGTIYHYDLNLVDAETGKKWTILAPGSGGKFIYSPDGSQIAIFTRQQIFIVDADGSNRHDNLLEFQMPTFGEAHIFPEPVWSADGQYLLLGLPPDDPMNNPTLPTTLWQVPADGSPAIRLGTTKYPVLPEGYNVTFSPDLKQLAYTTEGPGLSGYGFEIHIANFDGTNDRVIQAGKMLYFWNWSPDGQHFIYYSHPEPDAWYISDLDGNATVMDFLPVDVQLAWVNNESFLHYVHCGAQNCAYELRLASIDGETVVIDRSWTSPYFTFSYR
jgi:Tol biopolymer transport system component